MKTILFLAICLVMAGCLAKQAESDYPDYPPVIVEHNLQTEYDTCRWFFYRVYGISMCDVSNEYIFYRDEKPARGKYNELASFEVVLDTFAYRGDTIIFLYTINSKDYVCRLVDFRDTFDEPPGNPSPINHAIAVSLSQDTVIYVAEGVHFDNRKYMNDPSTRWYFGGSRTWGDAYSHPYWKKKQEAYLKAFITINPQKTHPWLLKQAKKRGWLPHQPTEK